MHLECQVPTQRYGRRPFGVGFLMAGFDVRASDVARKGTIVCRSLGERHASVPVVSVGELLLVQDHGHRGSISVSSNVLGEESRQVP